MWVSRGSAPRGLPVAGRAAQAGAGDGAHVPMHLMRDAAVDHDPAATLRRGPCSRFTSLNLPAWRYCVRRPLASRTMRTARSTPSGKDFGDQGASSNPGAVQIDLPQWPRSPGGIHSL